MADRSSREETPSFTVVLVTRNLARRGELGDQIASRGHDVIAMNDVAELDASAGSVRANAIILDLEVAERESAAVLIRQLRQRQSAPLVVISQRWSSDGRLALLDAGANECFTRQRARTVLMSRLRSLIGKRWDDHQPSGAIEVGPLRIDPPPAPITLAGVPISVTDAERRVLVALARDAGHVVALRQLAYAAWGDWARRGFERARLCIKRLRRKLELDPSHPTWLVTRWRVGYCLLLRPGALSPTELAQ